MPPENKTENAVEFKAIEDALLVQQTSIDDFIVKMADEMKTEGSARQESEKAFVKMAENYVLLADRLHVIEQKGVTTQDSNIIESVGEMFTNSDNYAALQSKSSKSAILELKTAIINATGPRQPLVQAHRVPGIVANPDRILTVRDLLPIGQTSSNLIEFAKENVFTNNAGPQVGGSPEAFENVTKPESGITFTLTSEAVQTIGHWVPASKQVIADSTMLQSYINARLTYGLKLKEETQLLTGSGANGELNGIYTQATAYSLRSPQISNEITLIRDMIRQAHASEYLPDAIILNPTDWYDIDVRTVGTGDDRYVVGNPRAMSQPMLWGLPVVLSNSMASGTALVGAFGAGAQIWDRMESTIEVSTENSDNFVTNMCTILAEERLALTVYRPGAFIKASI